ncbi:putative dehydrogenase [Devosia subaequoris]|uniref:Putative dehydrogenase n=1 Tax=Devosia subaequoris TaxID=395930 RepID=A0A7W6NAU3_9HYPH|nr:Gfo/Idh/MocA family oxidoreductase [Devosia subaequoris]MBB4051282.1 putative dehydrogenase [Devosia subaequoris]MCP1211419.1 Gfo/Idh/MocA family oxidoreductase [Devosia subaequoris]
MSLRVGIAGYGVVGSRRHQCLDRNPHTTVVAVADQRFASAAAPAGLKVHPDYRSMIAAEELDVVVICLTNDVAADATILALEKGCHVFCEKPPGRSVEEIRQVSAVEQTRPGLKLKYGFNHRYHESVLEAKRIIESGDYGKIISLRGVYGKSQIITFGQSDWRTQRKVAGGGVLLDQGIHMVDLMRLFAGDFKEVHSFISNSFWGYDVEDNAYALMRTADGVVAMLNSTATSWRHRFSLDITMERGAVALGGILSGSKSYGAETLAIIESNPEQDNGDPKETLIRYNRDPSWQTEVDDFVDHVLSDSAVESGSSLDALRTMEHVFRIYYSDPAWRQFAAIENPDA